MKIEQQVVSLELAEKLKQLGVKQESAFYWSRINGKFVQLLAERECQYELTENDGVERYSAFTVAELGEMIPCDWQVIAHDDCWVGYKVEAWSQRGRGPFLDVLKNSSVLAETEAVARAKMLIYLLENRLAAID
jgi:hypothetical protein